MEAKAQVESGVVEYGDSDDEQTREVSPQYTTAITCIYCTCLMLVHNHVFCRLKDMYQTHQMVSVCTALSGMLLCFYNLSRYTCIYMTYM